MQALSGAEERRTGLVGLVAHGDHRVARFVEVSIQRLALLARDIDAELGHGADREWSDLRRFSACRERLKLVAAELAQQAVDVD